MVGVAEQPDVFHAVAEPRRREILDFLSGGERPVNDVVARLRLPQPQVSKHLKVLREAGLVSARRDGKRRVYRVHGARLKAVHDWVKDYERFWQRQLLGVKEIAERRARESGGSSAMPS
ncbi:MAG: ArsR/SmtB family transcription factor [Phycisphaerales bacterium]